MKFYIENKELDKILCEIRVRLRTSMNGVVADSMREKGIVYKRNYGVDIPRLKEISAKYTPDHDLAQRLWASGTREMMIMATLLEPVESFTEDGAERWLQSVNNVELTEQACMNLFSKLPYAKRFSLRLTGSENDWRQIAGFTLAARLWKEFEENEAHELINTALAHAGTTNFHTAKAISLCLCRLCRRGKNLADYIALQTGDFARSDNYSKKYIAGEITNEMTFLIF